MKYFENSFQLPEQQILAQSSREIEGLCPFAEKRWERFLENQKLHEPDVLIYQDVDINGHRSTVVFKKLPETWVQDFLKQNSSITTNLVLDRSLGAVTALVIESTNPEYVGYVITQYQGKKFARKLQIENLSEKITELNKRLKTYQNTLVS